MIKARKAHPAPDAEKENESAKQSSTKSFQYSSSYRSSSINFFFSLSINALSLLKIIVLNKNITAANFFFESIEAIFVT